jgi:GNAT superfamily N-acetyltransferase
MQANIRAITLLMPEECAPLIDAADVEGHTFVRRLVEEYVSSANRFDQPGELLLGAWLDTQLVGIGGLNRDPYRADSRSGRLRHLYVLPDYRRHGVGRRLVTELVAAARTSFDEVTLRTFNPAAAAFYLTLGFTAVDDMPHVTHLLSFG